MLPKLGSIFTLAFIYFWASMPTGIALEVPPVMVLLTAWVSYTAGVVVVVLLGAPARDALLKRVGGKVASNPDSLIQRAWTRFGLLGLALLAPVTTGAQIGALIGLSLGAPPRKLIGAMALGAALWGMIITLVTALGAAAVRTP